MKHENDKVMKYETRNMKKEVKSPIIKNQSSKIIFVVGPTASGKSSLAMKLAHRLNGEIVCADSQTIRRGLDIGTAKPSANDRKEIKHHMLDIIGPYDTYSVNQFKIDALQAISNIRSGGKVPIIVGGTGLYINALFFDYELEESENIGGYKQKLEQLSTNELQAVITSNGYKMPENKDNPRHLVGTILRRGKTNQNDTPIPGALIYGLLPGDETLKNRINNRVDEMFASGFVAEVESLIETYGRPTRQMDAIGYPIVMRFLDGEVTLEEAKQLFKTAHWQYARRQKSWFKTNPYINWLNNGAEARDAIIREVKSY